MLVCARCGAESPEGFRFCGACGAPLVEEAAPRQSRKVVTALFCDVTGSTALGEELDPEVLRGVLNRYFSEIRRIIERHGGTVEKFIGDAVMAVFGIPKVQEDDALRAVRAAAEIRDKLPEVAREVGVELRFRTGVNTGPVLTGEGENLAVGDAVNVAARFEQTAAPGEIVLGEQTLALVRDAVVVEALERLELKGKSEPVAAYRLLSVDPEAPGFARHLDVPLVGRANELRVLREAWDRVLRESGCHLFTLLGEAGVGKSRLVAEFLAGLTGRAHVLQGRCLHYGEGITFWPLVEALMPVGEQAQGVLDQLSAGNAAMAGELFWEVRRLLEELAAQLPVILHIDDLQWSEPTLMDLVDYVVDLSRGAPLLLLCTARPELLEERAAWGAGKVNATRLLLDPLAAEDSEALLDALGGDLDGEARERVVSAGEGNPLFLEELVALARERGVVETPPTIQALLTARLEGLAIEDRELLQRGAVEGEVFHRLAVRALASERLAAEVEPRLAGLVRKELIRPHPATLKADDAFRFRHLLIRDAAYDALPKSSRAELHERFARWLERVAAELPELDEIAGWHLEQAIRYQQELVGSVDPELVRSAAEHLQVAGRRASARSDVPAATNLLERALSLASMDERFDPEIAIELAEQLGNAGDFARAEEVIATTEDDPKTRHLATVNRLEWMLSTDPSQALAQIENDLPELLDLLTKAGDERGIAKIHMLAFHQHQMNSQAKPASERARRAAFHAARAGDEGLRSRALGWYITQLTWGPAEASTIAKELDGIAGGHPGPCLGAQVDLGRGDVCWLEGDFGQALRLMDQAIERLEQLGMRRVAAPARLHPALVHISAGAPAAAVDALQHGIAVLAEIGDRAWRSTLEANLGWAHQLCGANDAAVAACETAEALSAPEDQGNYATLSHTRAQLALEEGDGERAEELARAGVYHASRTDNPILQAVAHLGLAGVLSALARRDEARVEAQAALELCVSKGDRPGAERARTLLHGL